MSDQVLEAARTGDEAAFERLVDPFRRELHAQCYRMLGSVHDADDAMQDALLKAWRGLPRFEGRSSVRTWLHAIATNACLDMISRRGDRVLPIDYAPPVAAGTPPGEPVVESTWIEPYPDDPLARAEERESIELAFVAALQHLPANQRAALLLCEVLGFSAKEAASTLDTSVASVNSALQRARAAIDARVPDRTQQETLRALGDEAIKELVDRYVQAWENCDVDAFVGMLAEDATFAMPPLATWYSGRESVGRWAAESSLSGEWRWRVRRTSANGQVALAYYAWNDQAGAFVPFAINVLSFRGHEVSDVVAFIARSIDEPDATAYQRWPEQSADTQRLAGAFGRFGLPPSLAA